MDSCAKDQQLEYIQSQQPLSKQVQSKSNSPVYNHQQDLINTQQHFLKEQELAQKAIAPIQQETTSQVTASLSTTATLQQLESLQLAETPIVNQEVQHNQEASHDQQVHSHNKENQLDPEALHNQENPHQQVTSNQEAQDKQAQLPPEMFQAFPCLEKCSESQLQKIAELLATLPPEAQLYVFLFFFFNIYSYLLSLHSSQEAMSILVTMTSMPLSELQLHLHELLTPKESPPVSESEKLDKKTKKTMEISNQAPQ